MCEHTANVKGQVTLSILFQLFLVEKRKVSFTDDLGRIKCMPLLNFLIGVQQAQQKSFIVSLSGLSDGKKSQNWLGIKPIEE